MAPPSVWTTPGVRGLVADVDDTVVVLLGPAVVVLVVVLVGEDVLELLDEDELDDDELLDVVDVVLVEPAITVTGATSSAATTVTPSPAPVTEFVYVPATSPAVAWKLRDTVPGLLAVPAGTTKRAAC